MGVRFTCDTVNIWFSVEKWFGSRRDGGLARVNGGDPPPPPTGLGKKGVSRCLGLKKGWDWIKKRLVFTGLVPGEFPLLLKPEVGLPVLVDVVLDDLQELLVYVSEPSLGFQVFLHRLELAGLDG